MKSFSRLLALVMATIFFAGCAVTNETSLVVGKARPAISPDQVKIYTKPPAKYEDVAMVSADAAHDFMSKQDLLDKSVAMIKAQAAKVGANGVLIENLGDFYTGSSGVVLLPGTTTGTPVIGTAATLHGRVRRSLAWQSS